MNLGAESLEQQAEQCLDRAVECDKRASGTVAALTGQGAGWYAEAAAWRAQAELWRDAAAALRRGHEEWDAMCAKAKQLEALRDQARRIVVQDVATGAVLAERRQRAHAILEREGVAR